LKINILLHFEQILIDLSTLVSPEFPRFRRCKNLPAWDEGTVEAMRLGHLSFQRFTGLQYALYGVERDEIADIYKVGLVRRITKVSFARHFPLHLPNPRNVRVMTNRQTGVEVIQNCYT
jgi:hypothetical protein